jgi:hypothetical protein
MPVPQELKPRKLPVMIWTSSGVRGFTDNNDIFALADPAPREAQQTLIAPYQRVLINEISHKTITLPKPNPYATTDRKFITSRFTEKPTSILFLITRLPFEDFFASPPSAGPQVCDFTQKRLERLLGVGDDGVVFLLFQDLFHRTSEDVHEFYSITYRPESSRIINFAAIIIGGISSLWPRTTILLSIAATRPLQAQGGLFRPRQCRRFVDRPAPGNQPPF